MKRYKISLILGLLIIAVLVWLAGGKSLKATSNKQEMSNLSAKQSDTMFFDTVVVTARRPDMVIEEIVVTAPYPKEIQPKKELSQNKELQQHLKSLQ